MNVKAFTFNAKIRSFLPLPILMLKFIGFSDRFRGRFDRDGKNEGRVQIEARIDIFVVRFQSALVVD